MLRFFCGRKVIEAKKSFWDMHKITHTALTISKNASISVVSEGHSSQRDNQSRTYFFIKNNEKPRKHCVCEVFFFTCKAR